MTALAPRHSTRRHGALVAGVVATAALFTACGTGTDAAPRPIQTDSLSQSGSSIPPPPVTAAELQQFADGLRTTTASDGGIVALVQGDSEPLVVTTGVADAETGRAIGADDAFHVASITKSYVAAALVVLEARGVVDLDAPIARWIDWPNGEAITTRQLLQHTSGVAPFGNGGDTTTRFNELVNRGDHRFTLDEVLAAGRDLPPAGAPGQATVYSNLNYALAGAVIEASSGQPFAEALDELVFTPAGIDDTWYPPGGGDGPAPLPGLYDLELGTPPVRTATMSLASIESLTGPAAGGVSTLADLLRWGRIVLRDRQLGDTDLDEMSVITPGGYGLGVIGVAPDGACVFDGCPAGATFGRLALNGDIAGASTRLLHDPATDTTLVVYLNRNALSLDDPMIAFLDNVTS